MERQCLQEIQPKTLNVSMATYPLFHCQSSSGSVVRDDYITFESGVDLNFLSSTVAMIGTSEKAPHDLTDCPTN